MKFPPSIFHFDAPEGGTNQLFRLFRLSRNNFLSEIANPNNGTHQKVVAVHAWVSASSPFVIIPRLYTAMQGRDMVRNVLWISYIFYKYKV